MGTQANEYHNLCEMHRSIASQLGQRIALRYKRYGLFCDLNWTDYRVAADRAAAGLINLGIKKGDCVAMLSENRYEWLVADHAVLSTGAANMPMHAPLAPKQVAYQVGHSEAVAVIVSNQAQADKLWAVLGDLPNVKFVVSFDAIKPGPIPVYTWAALQARGHAHREAEWEITKREAMISSGDDATIIYTSGTTGNPKGVVLTHGNLLSNAMATKRVMSHHHNDVLLSWLPYSHIYARTVDHYVTTLSRMTVALSVLDDLVTDMKVIRPTWVTCVPRFYEKIWSMVEPLEGEKRRKALREVFGPRLRQLSSGGAPLPKHVCEGFHAAGIPLLEGYGLTETSPVISFNRIDAVRMGSVGRAIPGVEVKIAEDGEVLTRGPHVMKGYLKNPKATLETIDKDDWLHTGDVGRLDDEGYLYITDRKKDLIITAGGKNIAPTELERLLVSDPMIDQAVVYGDARPFVSALIAPNFDELHRQADVLGIEIGTTEAFLVDPKLVELYQRRVDEVMEAVSKPERVKKILLLARPFELGADELTATLKVRRRFIISKYEAELAALYDETKAVNGDESYA